jgi:hypothetical protein
MAGGGDDWAGADPGGRVDVGGMRRGWGRVDGDPEEVDAPEGPAHEVEGGVAPTPRAELVAWKQGKTGCE